MKSAARGCGFASPAGWKRGGTWVGPGLSLAAGLLAVAAGAAPAAACGITAGGTAGITSCSLDEHEEAVRRKWHLGSSYAFSSTGLVFDGDRRFVQERHASLVTLEVRRTRRTTLVVGAGGFLGGHLRAEPVGGEVIAPVEEGAEPVAGSVYSFEPGVVAVAGGSWRALEGGRSDPFLLLTGQLSYAWARNQGASYQAVDVRVGAVLATTLWRTFTPYALARAFGGPVFWRYAGQAISGTDTHHYQLGAGLAVLIRRRVDLFVEGAPLGEQGLAAGAGLTF